MPRVVKWKHRTMNLKGTILLQNQIGNTTKYYSVNLNYNGKSTKKLVHKLIAEAFIGNVGTGMAVNHKDDNSLNNKLDNLEIITVSENVKQSWNKKHKSPQHYKCKVVDLITGEEKIFNTASDAGEYIGTTAENVVNHIKGIWSGIALNRYKIEKIA